MKRCKWLVLVACVALLISPTSLFAQGSTILTVKETDEGGKVRAVGSGRRFVDLNSRITVQIDKDSLLALVETNDELTGKLEDARRLNDLSGEAKAALEALRKGYEQWLETGQRQSYREAVSQTALVALQMMDILERSNMPGVHDRFNKVLSERMTVLQQYRSFFNIIAEEYAKIREEAVSIIEEQGTYFSLGGWLINGGESRPVHMTGFDEYSEREFYRADRFREVMMKISGEHQKMLQNFENRDDYPSPEEAAVQLADSFLSRVGSLEGELRACRDSLQNATEDTFGEYASAWSALRDDYYVLKSRLEGYVDRLRYRTERIATGGSTGDSGQINELILSISPLYNATEELLSAFTAFADSADSYSAGLPDPSLDAYRSVLNGCRDRILKVQAFTDLLESFGAVSEVNAGELELGDAVMQHSFLNLPSRTSFSLNRTGYRESGDEVVIKLVSGRSGEVPADLEIRRIPLERVLTHLKLAPGLLYARPRFDGDKGVSGSFHVAPSYSVLLKWGSRSSSFHNRLLQPGVGLNISALDFNKDNTPELGISLVGSVFMDYIQAGYGYNLNVETGFFTLGLRLPLASMTLAE